MAYLFWAGFLALPLCLTVILLGFLLIVFSVLDGIVGVISFGTEFSTFPDTLCLLGSKFLGRIGFLVVTVFCAIAGWSRR